MGINTTPLPPSKRSIHWGGTLFGLVFFCIGAAFLFLSVLPNLWDALRMRDWVQVVLGPPAG